jgi:hypothetical protein
MSPRDFLPLPSLPPLLADFTLLDYHPKNKYARPLAVNRPVHQGLALPEEGSENSNAAGLQPAARH